MTDADLEAEFLLGWATLIEPGGGEVQPANLNQEPSGKRLTSPKPSKIGSFRLAGESEERRERRLRQTRECSAHRRSLETTEQREKRLKEQRDRMTQKRNTESTEKREIRLKKAREREYERRHAESSDNRERRLQYSKERATMRREVETAEQRERRLGVSRLRAAQRRRDRKALPDDSSEQLSKSGHPTTMSTPREQMVTRQMVRTISVPGNQGVTTLMVQSVPTAKSVPGEQRPMVLSAPSATPVPGEQKVFTVPDPGEERVNGQMTTSCLVQSVPTAMSVPGEQRVTRPMVLSAPSAMSVPGEQRVTRPMVLSAPSAMPVPGEQIVFTVPDPREERVNGQMTTSCLYAGSTELVADATDSKESPVAGDYLPNFCVSGPISVAPLMCYTQTERQLPGSCGMTPRPPLGCGGQDTMDTMGGTASRGILGGTGSFERQYNHPDFRYSLETPQKLVCGVYPVMLGGGHSKLNHHI